MATQTKSRVREVSNDEAFQLIGIYVDPEVARRTLLIDTCTRYPLRASVVQAPGSALSWAPWTPTGRGLAAPQEPTDWLVQTVTDQPTMKRLVIERAAVDKFHLDVAAVADAAPWLEDIAIYGEVK